MSKKYSIYDYRYDQGNWVKNNNIKIGSKVIIKRGAKDKEKGWASCWHNDPMTFMIGPEQHNVLGINNYSGILIDCFGYSYYFPYFVLEPVNESQL